MMLAAGPGLPAAAIAQQDSDPYVDYRSRQEIDVAGYFRDFAPFDQAGGHADFGAIALDGYGRFAQVPEGFLDPQGKPVFNTSGFQVLSPWLDAEGNFLMPLPPAYVSSRPGDVAGQLDSKEGRAVSGAVPFAGWFRDHDALQVDRGAMRLSRVIGTDNYRFDGFIDGPNLRTGAPEADSNSTYTYEFETTFIYEDDRDYFIEANSYGDFWIFIDDRLVLDGGAGTSIPTNYAGIIVDGTVSMSNTATVKLADGTDGQVNTNAAGPGVVSMQNSAQINADVNVGPNSPANAVAIKGGAKINGSQGELSEPIPMPPLPTIPTGGEDKGKWTISGGSLNIDGDYRCSEFLLQTNATLNVRGRTRIICDGRFEIRNDCHVQLHDGGTLEIHLKGGPIIMGNNSRFNINTADPSRVTFYNHGSSEIAMDNGFIVYANFVSPYAEMKIANGIELFGSFFGKNIVMSNNSQFTLQARKEPIEGWGEGEELEGAQRIDLDRLAWLQNDRTYRLKIFFSDRVYPKSKFQIQTNIMTLNLANAAKDLAKVD